MTRNKIPDDIQNFYIQHEGFIGVFDDELKEKTQETQDVAFGEPIWIWKK